MGITGWDIGGVNTKMALIDGGRVLAAHTRPFELQRDPSALVGVLRELAPAAADRHAVTMTAELSQMFRTKRQGVAFVLDAVEEAFPGRRVGVWTTADGFIDPAAARQRPLDVAAANWAATAHVLADDYPDALLIDIGTTSADIIPIVGGRVVARGLTDPERLSSGELVYTGAVRTPAETMASRVRLPSGRARLSAEAFALSGDVHVWRGDLGAADYTAPTPDGRPATREFAGERLARLACADREMFDDAAIDAVAAGLAGGQVDDVYLAITQVLGRHRSLGTAVVAGAGAFIAERAAQRAGLQVVHLAATLGPEAARCAPAAAVGILYERGVGRT